MKKMSSNPCGEELKLNYDLDNDTIIRLLEIQSIIENERKNNMSIEEVIDFIKLAMSYGKFQIFLVKMRIKGIELPLNERIKLFLSQTSNAEILKLYDINQNYNEENIVSVRNQISQSSQGYSNSQDDEEKTLAMPIVTEENRKIVAKILMK